MKCVFYGVLFALLSLLSSSLATQAQDVPQFKIEPVTGMFLLELDELNRSLMKGGFDSLKSPLNFAGSWSSSKVGDLPVGASIAQGIAASEGQTRRAQLSLQLLSIFLLPSFQLSEALPQLRLFLSPGLAFGQAQLSLTQKPIMENNFDELLQIPHDTNLQRTFFAALPRVGVEFKLGEAFAFRGSAGYLISFWSTPWLHGVESLAGPPKDFRGLILEFVLEYKVSTGKP